MKEFKIEKLEVFIEKRNRIKEFKIEKPETPIEKI